MIINDRPSCLLYPHLHIWLHLAQDTAGVGHFEGNGLRWPTIKLCGQNQAIEPFRICMHPLVAQWDLRFIQRWQESYDWRKLPSFDRRKASFRVWLRCGCRSCNIPAVLRLRETSSAVYPSTRATSSPKKNWVLVGGPTHPITSKGIYVFRNNSLHLKRRKGELKTTLPFPHSFQNLIFSALKTGGIE